MDAIEAKMSEVDWSYGNKDMNALAILEKRIAETGRSLGLITYTDLVKGVEFHLPNINSGNAYSIKTYDWTGLDRRIIGDFLGYASYRSYKKHGFMISALVVNRDEFRPSWHFFDWMKYLGVLPDLEEDTVMQFWITQINLAHNRLKANRRI